MWDILKLALTVVPTSFSDVISRSPEALFADAFKSGIPRPTLLVSLVVVKG